MSKGIDSMMVVSDLHCGGVGALFPSEFTDSRGNTVLPNPAQEWLWYHFRKLGEQGLADLPGRRVLLLINGDCIEGNHHRTMEITHPREHDHVLIAYKCLAWLSARCAATIITEGTECHTKEFEHELARMLHAEGGKALPHAHLRIKGWRVNAAHHIGPTSRAYLEAGGLGIGLGNARLQASRLGWDAADIYLRGHRHCGGHYSDGHAQIIVTGGWQFLTRHGRKVVTDSVPVPTMATVDFLDTKGGLPRVTQYKAVPAQSGVIDL